MARSGAMLGPGRTWLRLVPKLKRMVRAREERNVSISEEKVVIRVEDWWCREGGSVGRDKSWSIIPLSLISFPLTKIKEIHTVRVKLPYSPQRLEDEDAVGPDISLDTVPLPEG